MSLMLVAAAEIDCAGPTWPLLYQSYARAFLDNQIRVIDRELEIGPRPRGKPMRCSLRWLPMIDRASTGCFAGPS